MVLPTLPACRAQWSSPRTRSSRRCCRRIPAPAFGLTQPVTVSGVDEIPDAVGIDPEVVSFLSNRSRSTVRVWANPDTGLSAAVGLTEYPYNVFAAAALAASIDDPEAEARAFNGTEDISDVHTFLGTGDKDGQVGAALRRGRLSAIVLVEAGDGGLQEAAGAVVDLTRQLDARLPAEASEPYRFPSPPSTFAGLAVTSAAVTAAGLASVGVGRARAWTLRRSDTPAVVLAAPPAPGSSRRHARRRDLRRRQEWCRWTRTPPTCAGGASWSSPRSSSRST